MPNTNLSTKNSLKTVQAMTIGQLGAKQPNYVKDENDMDAVIGVYRLTEATTFH